MKSKPIKEKNYFVLAVLIGLTGALLYSILSPSNIPYGGWFKDTRQIEDEKRYFSGIA